ncbi:MAG: BACON domain-containing protein [Candidatus Cryptobacteroides sp.]
MATKKNLSLLLLALALSGGTFVGCTSEEITRVPAKVQLDNADELGLTQLDFSNKSSSQTFTFSSSEDWRVLLPNDCDWVTVSPVSGKAGDKVQVTATVEANDAFKDRTALISFICGKIEQKAQVKIVQEMKYSLEVSVDRTLVNAKGGSYNFTVSCNSDWSYSISTETGDWLTESERSGNGLKLTAGLLQGLANSAVVTFECVKDPSVTQEIKLTQKDLELRFANSIAYVSQKGVEAEIPVHADNLSSWNATSSESWVTVLAQGDNFLKVKVDAGTGKDRTATLTLSTPDDESISNSITISQVVPKVEADLMNVRFNEDGSATDISKSNRAVEYVEGTTCTVSYREDYGLWAPNFNRAAGGSVNTGYYWTEMTSDIVEAFNDGYTLEAILSVNAEPNNKEAKALSSTKSGGTALMVGNNTRDGQLLFLINNNGTWVFVTTGVVAEPGTVYHLLGTWDKAAGKAKVYLDGEFKAEAEVAGPIKFGTLNPNFMMIGANQSNQTRTSINGNWNGSVYTAKIYSDPLSADEAFLQYLTDKVFSTCDILLK